VLALAAFLRAGALRAAGLGLAGVGPDDRKESVQSLEHHYKAPRASLTSTPTGTHQEGLQAALATQGAHRTRRRCAASASACRAC
jgi:hypothetical protein